MTPKGLRDEILQLPATERLKLLEEIWDSLAATPEEVPIPDWHRAELDRRLDNPAPGPRRHGMGCGRSYAIRSREVSVGIQPRSLCGYRGGFFVVSSAADRARRRVRGRTRPHARLHHRDAVGRPACAPDASSPPDASVPLYRLLQRCGRPHRDPCRSAQSAPSSNMAAARVRPNQRLKLAARVD